MPCKASPPPPDFVQPHTPRSVWDFLMRMRRFHTALPSLSPEMLESREHLLYRNWMTMWTIEQQQGPND
ncbi:hypothetical protein TWF694_002701 [Orbilia ellipsospora]|uniref:Uncharacterized protein n=1 Tax=Orbilia ellipsospora TaxID=2528407 RepID=A0AAV9X3W3_9PEZI